MPIPKNFFLWTNDRPMDGRDQVVEEITKIIEGGLVECDEGDVGMLNYVIACMCCLSAVANNYGGLTDYSEIEDWRKRALKAFGSAWADQKKGSNYAEERTYICSVLDSLFEGLDRSLIPEAREPWEPTS